MDSHSAFEAQANEQLRFWQSVLRLQDWIIELQFWPHEALGTEVSRVLYSRNQKTAIIALRYPEDLGPVEKDWLPGEAGDYDMSIVHELLHVLFTDMESKQNIAEEQSCNILSRAIVNLYRGNQQQVPHPSPPAGDGRDASYGHPGHYL